MWVAYLSATPNLDETRAFVVPMEVRETPGQFQIPKDCDRRAWEAVGFKRYINKSSNRCLHPTRADALNSLRDCCSKSLRYANQVVAKAQRNLNAVEALIVNAD